MFYLFSFHICKFPPYSSAKTVYQNKLNGEAGVRIQLSSIRNIKKICKNYNTVPSSPLGAESYFVKSQLTHNVFLFVTSK